jgi:hypothetical protein
MIIDNQNINIDDLQSQKYMHKEIKKGIFLSDYQIEILLRYGIDPNECGSINEIIYLIDEILDEEDIEELDAISREIIEFNYYSNTNK